MVARYRVNLDVLILRFLKKVENWKKKKNKSSIHLLLRLISTLLKLEISTLLKLEISALLKLENSCLLLFSEGLKFQALEGLKSNGKPDESNLSFFLFAYLSIIKNTECTVLIWLWRTFCFNIHNMYNVGNTYLTNKNEQYVDTYFPKTKNKYNT